MTATVFMFARTDLTLKSLSPMRYVCVCQVNVPPPRPNPQKIVSNLTFDFRRLLPLATFVHFYQLISDNVLAPFFALQVSRLSKV